MPPSGPDRSRSTGRGRGPQRRPQGARKGGRAPLDPARLAAFDVLKAVRVDGAYANRVRPHTLRAHALSGRDAAFATELASGTLRLQGTYDAVLAACVDRPLAKVEAKVLDLLRLGAHQLLAMRVPDHAAISTTVDLVKAKVGPGAASFANAVLRRVARHTLAEWVDRPTSSTPWPSPTPTPAGSSTRSPRRWPPTAAPTTCPCCSPPTTPARG